MPRIYTRKGDKGLSSLYPKGKVHKSELIFDVLGEIDELSSRIGLVRANILEKGIQNDSKNSREKETMNNHIPHILTNIQNTLIAFGSKLPCYENKRIKNPLLLPLIDNIEYIIDAIEHFNPRLTKFVLTGVRTPDGWIQMCRTQTRRCERVLYKFVTYLEATEAETGEAPIQEYKDQLDIILKYMNRLSDLFFVLGRYCCNGEEIICSPVSLYTF